MTCWTPDRLAVVCRFFGVWAAAVGVCPAVAQVQLSEVVSDNSGGLRDEQGEASDWVEIYNAGDSPVLLTGWGLSDRLAEPSKWVFPARALAAGARLVVFASGKDRTPVTGRLHTNFSLAAAGETLVLSSPDGQAVEVAPAEAIPEGMSLARSAEGNAVWRFFVTPTPGQPNGGVSYASLLRHGPSFSTLGGFHDEPVEVTVTAEAGAVVRYTLDGSEPDELSPLFPASLAVTSRAGQSNTHSMKTGTATANQHTDGWKPPLGEVRKATVVRARAFRPDAQPSPVVTHTYFIGAAARHTDGLPVLSLATDPAGLFDHNRGIYMLGQVFADYVAAHPGEPLTGHTPANYTQRGAAWNRDASLEFFEPTGARALAQPVQLDIKGQSTRSFRQKSFGLAARTDRGGRGRFEYALFPGLERLGDGAPLEQFRSLRLRNMGNDWAYAAMRDAYCHRLAEGLGLARMAWRPVSVYLDGEYWGLLEMREEQDADYFESHYGVPRGDVVIVNPPGAVVEGIADDAGPFTALRSYAETHDLAVPEHFAHVAARMDVESFLLYQLVQIWAGNADWPHNNTRVWRRRQPNPLPDPTQVPPGHDGRWRWILFDLDLAVGHPWAGGASENTLAHALSPTGRPPINAPWATALLRALIKNPQVKGQFVNLAADLLNSHFKENRTTGLVDAMRTTLQPAMREHIRRWQSNGASATTWANTHVQSIRNFASQRTVNVRQHFTTQLALGGYASLTTDVTPTGGGTVRINRRLLINESLPGTSRPAYPWRGTYFRTQPVTLEAIPAPGFFFAGWTTPKGNVLQPEIEWSLTGTTVLTARYVTAPTDSTMELRLANSPAGASPDLTFHGVPGAAYALEQSENLQQWTVVARFQTDANGRWQGPPPATTSAYYRVAVP